MAANLSEIQLKIVAGIDGLVEIGKLINELDALGGQTTESSAEVGKLVSELDALRQQDQLISEFQALKKVTAETASQLDETRSRATAMGKGLADSKDAVASASAEYKASKSATESLAKEWTEAKARVDVLSKAIKESEAPTKAQREELKAAREEAKQFGDQYRASSKETASLEKAMTEAQRAVKSQAKEFNAARKEVNALDDQYVRQQSTLNGLRTELQQSGLNTKNLSAAQKELRQATNQAQQSVSAMSTDLKDQVERQKRLQAETKNTADKTKTLSNEMSNAKVGTNAFTGGITGLTSRLVALAGTYLSISALKEQLVAMFRSGDQAERLTVQLRAVMGSIEGGKEATAWIQNFAKDTPLQLDEVTKTFVRLKSFGLDPMSGIMQAVVDQAYKLGGGFESVEGISLALGQAWAKQKLQGEEILQLIERGVPVWELLEKVTGKNTAELQKLSSAGMLGRDAIKSLMEEMGRSSQGAAAANMSTLSGLISNAKDNLEKFYRLIAENGALDWLKQQLTTLNSEFARMTADGSLQAWAKRISAAIVSAGESIKSLIQTCYEWSGALKTAAIAFAAFKFAQFVNGAQSAAKVLVGELIPALVSSGKTASGTAAAGATKLASSFSILIARANAYAIAIGAVVAAGYGIGEISKRIFDATEGMEIKNRIAEQERQLNDQLLRQGAELIAQNSQYKDLQIMTADQIKYLSETDRAAYEQRLNGLKNYLTGQLQQNAALENAGQLTEEQKNKTLSAVAAMREGYVAFAAGQKAALAQASKSVAGYTSDVESSVETTKRLADVGLNDVFSKASMDLDQISGKVGKTVTEYVSGLDVMTKASSVNAVAIQGYLEKAFNSAKNQAELDAISAKMKLLHDQGKLVGQPYIDSMAQAADAAKKMAATSVAGSTAYVDALKAQRAAVIEAYKTGEITADSYKQQVGKLNQEIDKTTKAIKQNKQASDTLNDAYKQLGIQSSAALEDIAAKNKKAYSEVKLTNEGLAVQRQAFLVYAESELKAAAATGRYADASLMAQAAALGLSDQLEALIKSIDTTGDSSGKTAEQLKEMLRLMGLVNGGGDQPQETRAEKNAKAIQKAMEATAEGARSAANYIADYGNALSTQLKAMSDGTELYYQQLMGTTRATSSMTSELDQLNAKLADNAEQWRRINAGITLDDIQGHIKDMGLAYLAAERAYLQQDKAVKSMTERLQSANAVSSVSLSQAEGLLRSSRLLGEEQLSGLRSALDSAKEKMAALASTAAQTLSSLRDELDQMNQNYAATEQRRYDTQIADLKAQMQKAEAAGNRSAVQSLQESLRLAEQIHKQKMETIKAEEAERNAKKAEAAKPVSTTNTVTPQPTPAAQPAAVPAQQTKIIRIELGNKSAEVSATPSQEASLMSLLGQLEAARGVTR